MYETVEIHLEGGKRADPRCSSQQLSILTCASILTCSFGGLQHNPSGNIEPRLRFAQSHLPGLRDGCFPSCRQTKGGLRPRGFLDPVPSIARLPDARRWVM